MTLTLPTSRQDDMSTGVQIGAGTIKDTPWGSQKGIELDGVVDAVAFTTPDVYTAANSFANISFGVWVQIKPNEPGYLLWTGESPNGEVNIFVNADGTLTFKAKGTFLNSWTTDDAYDDSALRFMAFSCIGATTIMKFYAFDINGAGGEIAATADPGSDPFDGVTVDQPASIGAQDAQPGGSGPANFAGLDLVTRPAWWDDNLIHDEADWQDYVNFEINQKLAGRVTSLYVDSLFLDSSLFLDPILFNDLSLYP